MIAFKCSACNRTLKIAPEHAGKLVKCPCQVQVRVPQPNSKPAQSEQQSEKIATRCPACNRQFRVPSTSVGKKLKCVCGNKFDCSPVTTAPSAPQAPTAAVAQHAASDDPFGSSDPAGSTDPFAGSDSSMWDDLGSTSAPAQSGFPAGPAGGAAGFPGQPAGNFQAPATPYQAPASAYQAPAPNPAVTAAANQSSRDALALASAGLQQEEYANQENSLYESRFFNPTVLGGIGMMGLAVVWFIGGLFVGYIFFYPPILFLFGFVGVIKGLLGEHG